MQKKSFNQAKTESKKKEAAFRLSFQKNSTDYTESESDLDSNVKGFCMLNLRRTNLRDYMQRKEVEIPFLNTKLLNVSDKNGRVYESMYTVPMNVRQWY